MPSFHIHVFIQPILPDGPCLLQAELDNPNSKNGQKSESERHYLTAEIYEIVFKKVAPSGAWLSLYSSSSGPSIPHCKC